MTDGDLLRLLAQRMFDGYRTIGPLHETETTTVMLERIAKRLDAWDQELKHIAVENADD